MKVSLILRTQRVLGSRFRSSFVNLAALSEDFEENDSVRPYSEIPGPKEYPIVGNSWRFAPFIGKFLVFLVHFFS